LGGEVRTHHPPKEYLFRPHDGGDNKQQRREADIIRGNRVGEAEEGGRRAEEKERKQDSFQHRRVPPKKREIVESTIGRSHQPCPLSVNRTSEGDGKKVKWSSAAGIGSRTFLSSVEQEREKKRGREFAFPQGADGGTLYIREIRKREQGEEELFRAGIKFLSLLRAANSGKERSETSSLCKGKQKGGGGKRNGILIAL